MEREKRIRRGVKIGGAAVLTTLVLMVVVGLVVMGLWNWLMPTLFAAKAITYWQAIGLLILARLLVGGSHSHPGGRSWRRRMRERWEHMTPEEREQFRTGMRGRCRGFEPPPRGADGLSADPAGAPPA